MRNREADRLRRLRAVARARRATEKIRMTAAIVDLQLHRREQGVGFKSIARKHSVAACRLRRLDGRFMEDGFYSTPGWEFEVLESGEITGTESPSDSGGD